MDKEEKESIGKKEPERNAEKKELKKREGERGVEQEGRRGERRGVNYKRPPAPAKPSTVPSL